VAALWTYRPRSPAGLALPPAGRSREGTLVPTQQHAFGFGVRSLHWHSVHQLMGSDVKLAHLPANFARHIGPQSVCGKRHLAWARSYQNIGDHFMVWNGDDVHHVR